MHNKSDVIESDDCSHVLQNFHEKTNLLVSDLIQPPSSK